MRRISKARSVGKAKGMFHAINTIGLLAGFLMILQNLLSVPALQGYNEKICAGHNPWFIVKKILWLSLFAE